MKCDLIDPSYSGSPFTLCNGWFPNKRVWKRLDRVLVDLEWMKLFDSTSVDHLISTGSDHSPLISITKKVQREPIKYFRFLDLWTEEADFISIVEQAWNIKVCSSPMQKFHIKLENTCKKLSEWSRNSIGNIFDKVNKLEKRVADTEMKILSDNSEANRAELNHTNALLIRAYETEEFY